MKQVLYGALVLALVVAVGCEPRVRRQAEPSAPESTLQKKIASMYEGYREGFPNVREMTVAELKQRRRDAGKGPLLIDGRSKKEWRVSMIPGALPIQTFEENPQDYAKGRPVVFYCTIGYRSGKQAREYAEKGFETYNLKGSVLSWAHAGGTFVTPEGEKTTRVHVYGKDWNLLPEGYEPVW